MIAMDGAFAPWVRKDTGSKSIYARYRVDECVLLLFYSQEARQFQFDQRRLLARNLVGARGRVEWQRVE